MFRKNNSSFIRNKTIDENFSINRNKEKRKMIIDYYSTIQNKHNDKELNYHIDCLREILEDKLPLNIFIKWFLSLKELLDSKNMNIFDFLHNLYFLNNDEDLSTTFFKYCYKFFNSKKYKNNPEFCNYCGIVESIYNSNILGSICFITPDIINYNNENKLGLVIDEISQGLKDLGQEIIIISPYYHSYNYKNMNLQKIFQISTKLDINYSFDIFFQEKNGIKYYFIYNQNLFLYPYPDLSGVEALREISCFSKSALELLINLNLIPEIIVTCDSYSGFSPAYARTSSYSDFFKNTKIIHLCNNIENQGRIYLPLKEGTYEHIHQLLNEIITDPNDWRLINPISCALRMCDEWATLSKSYQKNLLKESKLFNILSSLNEKKNPLNISSGISKKEILEIKMIGGDKEDVKRSIQRNYFCYKIYNPKIPLYSFIGNLNEENGALLLLDIAEKLFKETNNKINLLIIGSGNINDPYYQICLKKFDHLKKSFPFCIYFEPYRNFTSEEILLLIKGSDFGLIPFMYDNWINLHYKYFAAESPVIGYSVGHLKDAVKEFNFNNMTGNGFLFDHFNSSEFYLSIKRSLDLFQNEIMLENCRKNCEESVMDLDDVCLELCRELYKLKNKIFFNTKKIYKDIYDENIMLKEKKSYNNYYKNRRSFNSSEKKIKKEALYDSNHFISDYNEFGKNVNRVSSCKNCLRGKNRNRILSNGDLYTISYRLDFPQPKSVKITGSYDCWSSLKDLKYNSKTKKWEINLNLKKGKYYYKFLIDDKYWKINPFEHYKKEYNGIVNNVLYIV